MWAKRILSVMVWAVILGMMVPAFQISNYIAENYDGMLGFGLLMALILLYLIAVGVGILLLDMLARRLSAHFGWHYEEDTQK